MNNKRSLRVKRTTWFDYLNAVFLVLFSLIVLYPVWTQLVISVSPPIEAGRPGLHLWVNAPTLGSYERIFNSSLMLSAFFWSTLRVLTGCALSLVLCICFAYPLSRKTLWKRNFWMAILVFTMFFSGGLIPSYLLIRDLGMINSLWALILPGALVPFYVLMIRNYMMSLPEELIESAKMDGAGDILILNKVILPVCAPILATVTLWLAVGHWNAWFDAMLYIQKPPIRILQEILRAMLMEANQGTVSVTDFISQAQNQIDYTPDSMRAATLIVIIVPIVSTYPFLQRYFVKGVMMGSLKG